MKILIDECVPVPLSALLGNHDCQTVKDLGWISVRNGTLLSLACEHFDVFLTADQSVRYQQNLVGFGIAVVIVSTNNLRRLKAALDKIEEGIRSSRRGTALIVEIP